MPTCNENMKLKIKKIHPEAKMPKRAYQSDAGFDLFTPENFTILPRERKTIPLGLSMEIPVGYAGLLLDKSSLSHKHGIETFGGVIDAGYRGQIHAGLINLSDTPYTFKKGEKIIQMLVMPILDTELVESSELTPSDRGEGALGSSGK